MKDFPDKHALKLSWSEACQIVSDEIEEILGIQVSCSASVLDTDFWAMEFKDCHVPLAKICQLLQIVQATPEDWDDALLDKRDTAVRDISMFLTQKLISRHLNLAWEHALAIDDSLWLIGVTEDVTNPNQNRENRSDCSFPPELAQAILAIADRIRKQEKGTGISPKCNILSDDFREGTL